MFPILALALISLPPQNPPPQPQSPPSPLPSSLSVCSPLISEPMMLPRLLEWLDFHRVTAGVARFQLYLASDHGWFDASDLDAIKAYEAAGRLTRLKFPAFDGAFVSCWLWQRMD